ncbi:MAG TPA: MarR family transcriptional regulator [Pseudonocardiaceae bacterium]|nr:MarR family transcriptional regulator [Pseudonocardiaceae bacterium]
MIEASTSDSPRQDVDPQRDEQAVAQFVERFGSILVEAGFPRMAARVFVALISSESSRLTAAQLADQLQASPAAISGAVRFLVQVDLASRQRDPGSRRDYYVVDDDVWYQVIDRRMTSMTRWGDHLAAGIAAVGKDTEPGARLADMVAFFEFLQDEMPGVMRRWHEHRTKN